MNEQNVDLNSNIDDVRNTVSTNEISETNTFHNIIENRSIIKITRYVNSLEGLNIRNEPNINSTKILTIPCNSQVDLLAIDSNEIIIDGIKNYWYLINYNEITGWVFGGYLVDEISKLVTSEIDSYRGIADFIFVEEEIGSGRYDFSYIDIIEQMGNAGFEQYIKVTNNYFILEYLDQNQYRLLNHSVFSIFFTEKIVEINNSKSTSQIFTYLGENAGHTYLFLYYGNNIITAHFDFFRPGRIEGPP
ncbi:MAG: SH3 domain-containing protein [Treponema sp.]|nr:SH3 domain-containing protein [Treponema sp.]